MKKLMLVSVLGFFSFGAQAQTVLSVIKGKNFVMMGTEYSSFDRVLNCYNMDNDRDGKADTARLTLKVSSMFSDDGPLMLRYLANDIADSSGKTCKNVEAIYEGSFWNYGVIYGKYDSTLTLDNGNLIEKVSVTLNSYTYNTGKPSVSVSLTGEITRQLSAPTN